MRYWLLLMLAAAFEIGWVIGLKSLSAARPVLALAIVASYLLSFACLTLAVRGLPLGVSYAVWTGIGVAGAFAYGALRLHERPTAPQLIFAAVALTGIIGLFLTTHATPSRSPTTESTAVSR